VILVVGGLERTTADTLKRISAVLFIPTVTLGYLRGLEIPFFRLEVCRGYRLPYSLKTNVMRLFITALACLISVSLVGQIFEIKVEEMFSKPDYLAINQNSDVLNLVGTINASFQREGFNVVNIHLRLFLQQ
jgi:hypothetical protein